jgi:hypothetical protein
VFSLDILLALLCFAGKRLGRVFRHQLISFVLDLVRGLAYSLGGLLVAFFVVFTALPVFLAA